MDRAARAIRILVDTSCLALLVYCLFAGIDHVYGIVVFWLVSLVVFPYARMAKRPPGRRELDWGFIVLGVLIVGAGLIRDVGPVHSLLHGTPTNDSMLMGVALALGGLTNVLYVSRPPSMGRLLLGGATLVAGAVWLWFTIAAAPRA